MTTPANAADGLTIGQIARRCNVPPQVVKHWLRAGVRSPLGRVRLNPAFRLGGCGWRVRAGDVDAWVREFIDPGFVPFVPEGADVKTCDLTDRGRRPETAERGSAAARDAADRIAEAVIEAEVRAGRLTPVEGERRLLERTVREFDKIKAKYGV